MRLVTFRKGKANHLGAIVGDSVADIVAASRASGGPALPADMIALLDMGAKGLRAAKAAARFALKNSKRGLLVPLELVRLEAPVPCPRKLLALAGNYSSHLKEEGKNARAKREQTPRVFMKPPSTTVNRPGGPIPITRYSHFVDWEVELGIVIGRKARDVSAKDASRHIAGYTIVNDISEREFCVQKRTKTEDFDKFFDWLNGKWPDGFAPMGPCITTPDEIGDPMNLAIRLSVNGTVMQDANTSGMIYNCAEIVSFISRWVTLEPGDIIATGTPAGIGKVRGIRLRPGDLVRCEIEKIGVLENRVVKS
ncbi:MAG TPA: fumarylacetoacetate hydrolase family protein [Planctomycetota bacterium]|nr:fumarylacetoacetate hydrolase family protein [Planctomycetota bacterium]